uniref:Adenosine A2b receptor n=1 Tax=Ovis aries TaxID=9940 RepID=A0AC11EGR2_SHEEP
DARAPGGHPRSLLPSASTPACSPESLAVPHLRLGPGSAAWTLTVLPSWGCSSGASYASALNSPTIPPGGSSCVTSRRKSFCHLLRTAYQEGSRGLCQFPRGCPRSWGRGIPGTSSSFGKSRGRLSRAGCTHTGPVAGYKSLVTGARARGVIAALWGLAFGIGLTPFLGWNSRKSAINCTEPGDGAANVTCCLIRCLFENVVPMSYMVYFNFFGCVLPPLLIMLVIYVKIFLVACRQLQRTELMDHSRTVLQREIHAAKSLAMIVGIFALCWLPVHAINCASLFQPTWAKEKPKWAMNIAILLSHANSAVNPIVYAYRNRDFRYTFHKIISRYILCQTDVFKSGEGQVGSQPTLQLGL